MGLSVEQNSKNEVKMCKKIANLKLIARQLRGDAEIILG